jgi:hemoglobin
MRIRTIFASALAALCLTAIACGGGKKGGDTTTTTTTPAGTLYERLGGQPAIEQVVGDFITIVVADDRINAFFQNADANNLKKQLVDQICKASGGPCDYQGKDMRTAHTGMGIKEEHFNALVEDLGKALDQNSVPEREKNELLGALAPMKDEIVQD